MSIAYTAMPLRSKAPTEPGWNKRENIKDKSELNGGNHGILLAFCDPPLVALDIDHMPSAKPQLKTLNIDFDQTKAVKIESGRPNSACMLFKLPVGTKPIQSITIPYEDGTSWELRCGTAKGNSQCQIVPPSIHPSGTPYCWIGEVELDEITEIPQALLKFHREHLRAKNEKRSITPIENSSLNEKLDEETLQDMLNYVSADCSYNDWLSVLFSIRSTGLPNAESIARAWSKSAPSKFESSTFLAVWNSYKPGHITQGTVIYHARQGGWRKQLPTSLAEALVNASEAPCEPLGSARESLLNMAINNNLEALRQQMLDDVFVMPEMAILGQITVFYAKPNTGKTLYLLHGLINGVKSGVLAGKDIIFINADDTFKGAVEKAEILNEFGIKALVPNQNGFKNSDLLALMQQVIDSGDAKDLILAIDTTKKFTDLMDKKKTSEFTELARQFVQAGGTLIGTAHANKHDNAAGEVVEAGTSDLKDDIDCAFTLKHIGEDDGTHTVEFTNTKNRGDVAPKIVIQYTKIRGAGYAAMLKSVERIDSHELEPLKVLMEAKNSLTKNEDLINAITHIIKEGKGDLYKGKIVDLAKRQTGKGINSIRSIIELHEGDNYYEHHRWTSHPDNHGSKYELLEVPAVCKT